MEATAKIIQFPTPYVTAVISSPTTPFEDKTNKGPVEPIYSVEDIQRIKNYLLSRNSLLNANLRDFAYFIFSINTGRRAGDILSLHVIDVLNEDGSFKSHVKFRHEQKTGKKSTIILSEVTKRALAQFLNTYEVIDLGAWLFPNIYDQSKPATVEAMRKMLQRTGKALGLKLHIGTHSMRKTCAYHMLNNSRSVQDEALISQFLCHSDIKTTYAYIGRTQDEIDQFVLNCTDKLLD